MKKNFKYFGLVVTSLLLLTACGTIPTLENGEEAVVEFKDENMFSVDELYTRIKDNYGVDALVTMIDLYVLENEFKDDVEDAKTYAESYIQGLIESNGGEDALLSLIQNNTNYSTIAAYEEYLYLSYLQSIAIEAYAEEIVTDEQIEKYYNEVAKGDIEVSHILITPDVESDATEEEITAAEDAAKEIIDEIITELKSVDEDEIESKFSELVVEYSEDDSTKDKDGDLGKINYHILDENYDELIDSAYELDKGEYSTEVITTEYGYHVILVTDLHELEALEDIKEDIRDILRDENLASVTTISLDALEHYREKYEVNIIDSELNKQYNDLINALYNSFNTETVQ